MVNQTNHQICMSNLLSGKSMQEIDKVKVRMQVNGYCKPATFMRVHKKFSGEPYCTNIFHHKPVFKCLR